MRRKIIIALSIITLLFSLGCVEEDNIEESEEYNCMILVIFNDDVNISSHMYIFNNYSISGFTEYYRDSNLNCIAIHIPVTHVNDYIDSLKNESVIEDAYTYSSIDVRFINNGINKTEAYKIGNKYKLVMRWGNYTGNVTKDVIFVPSQRENYYIEQLENEPLIESVEPLRDG